MAALPTDYSPLTLQRYADLAATLQAQFAGRFSQLDCGPGMGVIPHWISPPTQAETDALAATVSGWTWGDTISDFLARRSGLQAALACALVLGSSSAASLTTTQKARLKAVIDNQAAALVAAAASLLGN